MDEAAVRDRFDANEPFTIGLEEEVVLVDRTSLAPVDRADDVVDAAADRRIKRELPACQVELLTRPQSGVAAALAELASARALLIASCPQGVAPVACAVHPTASAASVASSPRHVEMEAEYGEVARRQLVGALQIHVALGSADRTLAVYNALRGHLPDIAALAAAAPFYEGRDTGLASVRPLVAGQLPRQGVPPVIASWRAFADDLRWGARAGCVREPRRWWWELRPHVVHGTLEVRVPDVQASAERTATVTRVVHALVRHLAARHDDGEDLGVPPTWRIAENRWNALRDGVDGQLADLVTGEVTLTRTRLHALFDLIEPHAEGGLDGARDHAARGAASAMRQVGLPDVTAWMVSQFESRRTDGDDGASPGAPG